MVDGGKQASRMTSLYPSLSSLHRALQGLVTLKSIPVASLPNIQGPLESTSSELSGLTCSHMPCSQHLPNSSPFRIHNHCEQPVLGSPGHSLSFNCEPSPAEEGLPVCHLTVSSGQPWESAVAPAFTSFHNLGTEVESPQHDSHWMTCQWTGQGSAEIMVIVFPQGNG